MAKAKAPRIGGWKFVFMLLITWLTFSGLGNLIFLWNDLHYRKRAAIALGLSLGTWLIILILAISVFGAVLIPLAMWLPLGMAIWMTFDAISAYKKYRPVKSTGTVSKPTVPAAPEGKPAKPKQTRTPTKSARKKS